MRGNDVPESTLAGRSRELIDIQQAASDAAQELQTSASAWMFRPATDFAATVEKHLTSTEGNVRLCLASISTDGLGTRLRAGAPVPLCVNLPFSHARH